MADVTLMKGHSPPEGLAGFSGFGDQVDYHEAAQTTLQLASVAGLGYVTVESSLPGWARVLTGLAALQQGMKLLKRFRGAQRHDDTPPADGGDVEVQAQVGPGGPKPVTTDDGTPMISLPSGAPLRALGVVRVKKYRPSNFRVRV